MQHCFSFVLVKFCFFIIIIIIIYHTIFIYFLVISIVESNSDAGRLFEDLLRSYIKWTRPVEQGTAPVKIEFKMKLLQILDVVHYLQYIS